MSLVPEAISSKIEFFESKAPGWVSNAAGLGVSPALAATLVTQTTQARADLKSQTDARAAAKGATATMKGSVRTMGQTGADLIAQIRAKAATGGNAIWILAGLPVPATPAPAPAPGQPTALKLALQSDGSLELTWKCVNPAGIGGTIYQISRRVGATGAYTPIGVSGKREFMDTTVPAGVPVITYKIQAIRSTLAGEPGEFIVNMGVSGGGMTVTALAAPKLAA